MIESIRIENLRSLRDTGFIDLKKINILVGANSSGKSTFIRSFPLIAQSIKKNLQGPISWFDNSLVDFGDYKIAKNKFVSDRDTIRFSFHIKKPAFSFGYRIWRALIDLDFSNFEMNDPFDVRLSFSNDAEGTFIEEVSIFFPEAVFKYGIGKRNDPVSLYINGEKQNYSAPLIWYQSHESGMLPKLYFNNKSSNRPVSFEEVLYKSIVSCLKRIVGKPVSSGKKMTQIIENWSSNKSVFLQYLRTDSPFASIQKKAIKWSDTDDDYLEIYKSVGALYSYLMCHVSDLDIEFFYRNSSYIAPVRAEANRFYRNEDLRVDDIDAYGKNLAEFLMALTSTQKKEFEEFCKSLLGLKVSAKRETGHNSIVVEDGTGEYNLIDVGFGYSQLLPIITKLWYCQSNESDTRYRFFYADHMNRTILIEQPELHLHPALQAKMADAMIHLVNSSVRPDDDVERFKTPTRIIIETHSQALINRFGRRIKEGLMAREDVNILLFQKDEKGQNTIIQQCSFNENGQIVDWPYGFFDTED